MTGVVSGGEMRALMRALNWGATSLGPIEGWPQSLRTATGLCLNAGFPSLIWWGPELVLLYNDAARPILELPGHGLAFGQPGQVGLSALWPTLGPPLRRMLERGADAWPEEQIVLIKRSSAGAGRYVRLSYSPILDEAGEVGGVFCIVSETTQGAQHERALAERAGNAVRAEEAVARGDGQTPSEIMARARAEAALQQSDAHYHTLTELSLHMVWALAPDGEITYLSQTWFDYTGLSWDEVRASGWQHALHPDERAAIAAALRRHLGSGEAYAMELRLRAKDGSYRWHLTRAAPVLDAQGAVERWLGVTFDIDERKQAEEALRASEERYRSLTHMLSSVVWLSDAGGAFVTPQPEWAAFTGLDWEAHRGWGWVNALHPDDRGPVRERWRRALAAGTHYEVRGRIWYAPGNTYHHFVAQAVPLHRADGTVREWIGTLTDTHEQEQRERDARFMADLAERIRLATSADELLAQVATAVGEHLQVRRCLIIDIDVPADKALVRAEHCRGAPSVSREYRVSAYSPLARAEMQAGRTIVNADAKADARTAALYAATYEPAGERAYVAVPLMRDRHWTGTLWISDDVPRPWEPRELTLLEMLAERVWLAVEKLNAEQALRTHAAQLLELYTAAQDAVRIRDQFLSVASHELKTPLTSLLGYSQTLLRRVVREASLGERDQRVLRQIAEQAMRLNRLIDALLDVSRIEGGSLSIERAPLDLSVLLRRCVDAFRATIEQHTLELTGADRPLPIQGDELRLEQVIQNLLSNAVKYSPLGGTVRVALSRSGDEALIAVSDQGIGIAPEAIPQLFQRFYRVTDAATRHIAGMGIGLYVVKEIVGLHGGVVTVESTAGTGSTFLVRLPCGEAGGADR